MRQYPRGAGVYPQALVPIALPGDYVRLQPSGDEFKVKSVEPEPGLDAFDSDLSNGVTASSNDTTSDQAATELEQRHGYLGQMRLVAPHRDIPSELAEVEVDQGGAQQPLWSSVENRGYINNDTQDIVGYSGLTEFYIWQDENTPKFTFTNNTGSDVTVNDVQFAGFHIELESASVPSNVVPVQPITEAVSSVNQGPRG